MKPFTPSPLHHERQARAAELDRTLPSDVFSLGVRQALYRYALIRNSWGTTNIDAGPIALDRVAELHEAWQRGATRAGRILPSEVEVVNYFQLVDALPTGPFDIEVETLRASHRAYFRDVPLQNDARPGAWKNADNVVAGPYGVLRTTPKERVERDLQALVDWLGGPAQDLPALVRAALFFHEFQRIHPFGDGNGRAGRLATLLVLSTGGLPAIRLCPIDDAINEDREEYYVSLAAADRGDPERWVDYFTAQALSGYQRSHLLARRLQRVPTSVPLESQRLLEYLYVHKVVSFKPADVKSFYLGESRSTFLRRLKQLEALGLVEGKGRGAGRAYEVVSLHAVEGGKRSS